MGLSEGGGTGGAGLGDGAELIGALDAARGDLPRVVALLWTWLARRRGRLGSRREKLSAIRSRVQETSGYDEIDDETLAWLAEDPLPRAAELLTRIGERLATNHENQNLGGRSFDETTGIDGRRVVVALRHPRLAALVGGGYGPPDAVENPWLSTLAPRLTVSPVEIEESDIELEFRELEGSDWEMAWDLLEEGLAPGDEGHEDAGEDFEPYRFKVHLDPLREHGLEGLLLDDEEPVGRYDPAKLEESEAALDECIAAAREAIADAGDGPGILILPELAAAPGVEEAIKEELAKRKVKPTLTVVGLYHHPPAPGTGLSDGLVDEADLAPWVNEAIVLGPSGDELWRHRKLSYAEALVTVEGDGGAEQGEPARVAEDIQLGRKLVVVPTPLGNVGLVICLDSFAPHVCERIEKSAADVVLVPSLSPKTERHRFSLTQIVQGLYGIAFVCNRSPFRSEDGIQSWNSEQTRSFWAVQREGGMDMPPWDGQGHPSFVFELKENLAA